MRNRKKKSLILNRPASTRVLRRKARSKKCLSKRFRFERLEERALMAGFNDPDYSTIQWGLDNVGQNGYAYDVDIDAPEAWSISTGSMKTVLAEIDDGVDFTHPDVYLNIWLNQGEIPNSIKGSAVDIDGDEIITFRDLNNSANASWVTDLNGTGYIDGGDLLADARWVNNLDEDNNGKFDDLVGWDFFESDNDPRPDPATAHGTGVVQWMAGIPNNGIGRVGVNWYLSVMPVRVREGDVNNIDFSVQAAGLDYAVGRGAPISAIWGRSSSDPQIIYDAIERARIRARLAGGNGVHGSAKLATD